MIQVEACLRVITEWHPGTCWRRAGKAGDSQIGLLPQPQRCTHLLTSAPWSGSRFLLVGMRTVSLLANSCLSLVPDFSEIPEETES